MYFSFFNASIAHYLNFFFQCGSLISIYGVFLCNRKRTEGLCAQVNENGMEEGQQVPLLSGKPSNLIGGNIVSYSKDQSFSSTAVNIWCYIFEVLFQVNFLCNFFFYISCLTCEKSSLKFVCIMIDFADFVFFFLFSPNRSMQGQLYSLIALIGLSYFHFLPSKITI